MDSDEEAALERQGAADPNPSLCLLNLGTKPDICLLSLGLLNRDKTGSNPTSPINANNISNSNANIINNNNYNKATGVREISHSHPTMYFYNVLQCNYFITYSTFHSVSSFRFRAGGRRSWICMLEPAVWPRVRTHTSTPGFSPIELPFNCLAKDTCMLDSCYNTHIPNPPSPFLSLPLPRSESYRTTV